jgi:hypothetical protein
MDGFHPVAENKAQKETTLCIKRKQCFSDLLSLSSG